MGEAIKGNESYLKDSLEHGFEEYTENVAEKIINFSLNRGCGCKSKEKGCGGCCSSQK